MKQRGLGGFPHERLLNPLGLNIVEIEFSVLSRQCLNRRSPDIETIKQEIDAWTSERNRQRATINLCFTNQDARVKLKRLYPQSTCHN